MVQMDCGGCQWHTNAVRSSLNPVWNEEFVVQIVDLSDPLTFEIWDVDCKVQTDRMGRVDVDLNEILGTDILKQKECNGEYEIQSTAEEEALWKTHFKKKNKAFAAALSMVEGGSSKARQRAGSLKQSLGTLFVSYVWKPKPSLVESTAMYTQELADAQAAMEKLAEAARTMEVAHALALAELAAKEQALKAATEGGAAKAQNAVARAAEVGPSLASVMAANGLEQHTDALLAEELTLQTVADLTHDDMKELGIPMGPRKAIAQLFGCKHHSSSGTGALQGELEGLRADLLALNSEERAEKQAQEDKLLGAKVRLLEMERMASEREKTAQELERQANDRLVQLEQQHQSEKENAARELERQAYNTRLIQLEQEHQSAISQKEAELAAARARIEQFSSGRPPRKPVVSIADAKVPELSTSPKQREALEMQCREIELKLKQNELETRAKALDRMLAQASAISAGSLQPDVASSAVSTRQSNTSSVSPSTLTTGFRVQV